jgi:ATP-dependent Clp protease, protease subunit
MNKLMSFYRANAGKGAGITARMSDEPEVFVYDVIVSSDADAAWLGGASAEAFARTMAGLNAQRVHVRVNSPGGDAFAGIAMANTIRAYPGEVVVHVDGYAASAAGFLVAAASRVVMGSGAMIMVHKAWTIAMGNSNDMMKQAEVLEKLDGQQIALFAEKNDDYDWESALTAETWFNADEAIAIGLATEKAGDKKEPMAKALAFDLSAFENPPVVAAVEPVANDDEGIEKRRRVARLAALKVA